jgi:hypothetical protein
MPVKQTLEGIPCVQYSLALGEKKVRRCCYCKYPVKKDISIKHQCNSRMAKLMREYVELSLNYGRGREYGFNAGREISPMVVEDKEGPEAAGSVKQEKDVL